MSKLLALLIFLLIPQLVSGQTFINETFSGAVPPSGWTVDAHSANWKSSGGNLAGGTAPECKFDYSPSFTGLSSLISPQINLTGISVLKLMFRHSIDHYSGNYTVGVATRSGGGVWNTVWSRVNPTGNMTELVELTINNSNVGAADFQICWFFNGNSENIDYWYIDDLLLYSPLPHDAAVKSILTLPEYIPGVTLTPQAILSNRGLNSETFNATCIIKAGGTILYTQTCGTITLGSGLDQTVSFPNIVLSSPEEIYEITVTTNLSGDMNTSNDTKTTTFDTYTTPRIVILEIATGTWCPYCPGAAMGAHDLLANGKAVGVVKYHNGDSFTNSYSDARNSYYGVSGYPTATFDGILTYVGGSYSQSNYPYYLPLYENRKAKNSAYSLEIFGTHSGSNYNIQLRVRKLGTVPASNNNLVVHLALTESNIPYSWQGQTQINNAERLMAPNQNGTSINFTSGNEVIIDLTFTVNASWVVNNLELVSFIQNVNGKEILQGAKIPLQDIEPLSATPSAPVLVTPSNNSTGQNLNLQFKWRKADRASTYTFELALDSLFSSMVTQDSLLTDTTKSVSGLSPNNVYYWRVKGKNNIGTGPYSLTFCFSTVSTFPLTVVVNDGWNLVSIPGLHPVNQNVTTWWSGKDPGAGVFRFSSGYQLVTTAEPGVGYWMKHLGAQTYNTGDEWPAIGIMTVPHNSIPATGGWNLIGGYEQSVSASGLTSSPPGLISGAVYKYSGGYQTAATIDPGYGYWVKLTSAGVINIPAGGPRETVSLPSMADFGKIIITDNASKSYTIYAVDTKVDLNQYDLPPYPPQGMFDIRYSSQRCAENLSTPQGIEMAGVQYPVKVKAVGTGIILSDETGKEIARLKAGEEVTLNTVVGKLMVSENVIPSVYSLEQNYPNPFNPGTTIQFSIPEDVQNVKLIIYDALGEKVAELVNTGLQAGTYKYNWNASDLASGLYIYKIVSEKFVSTKKMMLLK